jgi:hypothetical protein
VTGVSLVSMTKTMGCDCAPAPAAETTVSANARKLAANNRDKTDCCMSAGFARPH